MKRKIGIAYALILLSSIGCSLFGVSTTEEATYEVLKKASPFEIRQYPKLVLAQTRVDGDWRGAQSEAFGRLFSYISGENSMQEKIAMTAPVFLDKPTSRKIEMTTPVFQSVEDGGVEMSFVLPAKYTIESAPKPSNENVRLVESTAQKRLVYTFSGLLNPGSTKKGKTALLRYAKENEIEVDVSSMFSAGYNPPWTIPWFRRNEVLADIKITGR